MLLTLTQSLEALTKEVQCMKNHKTITVKNSTYKQTTYWDGVPFWEKPGWRLKYCWTCGSGFHEENNFNSKKEGHTDEATYEKCIGEYTRQFKIGHY